MSDTKISALAAMLGTNVDKAADVLPIVDTSLTITNKILVSELFATNPTFSAGAVIAASQALTGTAANSTISGFLSVSATNFISGTTTTTAFAGATVQLNLGGTGATSVVAIPGTLEATGTTGSVTLAGGLYVAKAGIFTGALTAASLSTGSGAISGGAGSFTTGSFSDNITQTGSDKAFQSKSSTGIIASDGTATITLPTLTGVYLVLCREDANSGAWAVFGYSGDSGGGLTLISSGGTGDTWSITANNASTINLYGASAGTGNIIVQNKTAGNRRVKYSLISAIAG